MMCTRHWEAETQEMMPPEIFERALPAIRETEYVFFVGWGEPLLSPHLVDFLRAAGGKDHTRGFATNGHLLKGDLARRILEEGAYSINISIDASTPETYHRIRGSDQFGELMETVRDFIALRNSLGSRTLIQWVFVLMKSNVHELAGAVGLAASLGFDKFAAKHIETAKNAEGVGEALYDTGFGSGPSNGWLTKLNEAVDESHRIAEGRISLSIHPVSHGAEFWGLQGPFFKVFLDYRGNLSPCPLICQYDTKPFTGRGVEEEWFLGNIMEQPIEEILRSSRFAKFQESWLEGRIPPACQGCLRLGRLGADGFCYAL
jgi:MoaA/NifB/PqqE/SkfB family radical SAM enzyme